MNTGNAKKNISCPVCKKKQSVSLNDFAKGKKVKCACGHVVTLVDKNRSIQKGISKIDKAFSNLEKSFKKLSK